MGNSALRRRRASAGGEGQRDGGQENVIMSPEELQRLVTEGQTAYSRGARTGHAGQGNSDADAVPLRQAKTLRNPFSLQRKSLKLKRVDADTIHLSFKFDAIEECKVSVAYFVAEIIDPRGGGIPLGVSSSPPPPPSSSHFWI